MQSNTDKGLGLSSDLHGHREKKTFGHHIFPEMLKEAKMLSLPYIQRLVIFLQSNKTEGLVFRFRSERLTPKEILSSDLWGKH